MQIAEILSDLNSLRVCDHDAAIALVTSHQTLSPSRPSPPSTHKPSSPSLTARNRPENPDHNTSSPPKPTPSNNTQHRSDLKLEGDGNDPDLQRAIDLVDLHYGVKVKHMQSLDMGLRQARLDVNAVLEKLKGGGKVATRGVALRAT
ncbi:hypothetical protein MMC24_000430 [Lignoscripta atroalba]|nr:hypothetical protein [Lignoscripta atroalba]